MGIEITSQDLSENVSFVDFCQLNQRLSPVINFSVVGTFQNMECHVQNLQDVALNFRRNHKI